MSLASIEFPDPLSGLLLQPTTLYSSELIRRTRGFEGYATNNQVEEQIYNTIWI